MDQSISDLHPPAKAGDRQRGSIGFHEGQQQRDFGGVAEVREPVLIDWRMVRMCHDEMDALNLCIDLSRQKDEYLCASLGIDKGHWSRIRKGRAHFPTAKRLALMTLCGNWAPLQYELEKSRLLPRLAEMLRPQQQYHPAQASGYDFQQGAAA